MTITFSSYHDNPTDSQLIICMTGDKNEMIDKLKSIIAEIQSDYGKPCQNVTCSYNLTTSIITPIWEGKQF